MVFFSSLMQLKQFQMLSGLFERCMKRRGVKEADPFDWEKTPTDNSLGTTTTTTHAVITKPQHVDRLDILSLMWI